MTDLSRIGPAFIGIAHRIVWATVATVDPGGAPRTRVLHPIWEFGDDGITGWVATSPLSPKAAHLEHEPRVSVTYWDATQDTCTADCDAAWELAPDERIRGWNRFANGPAPVGYDPRLIPQWTAPEADDFGILRLEPTRLRVMPGALMMAGEGELMTWRR